jgi:endonuclease YncB( thermonuclease family)
MIALILAAALALTGSGRAEITKTATVASPGDGDGFMIDAKGWDITVPTKGVRVRGIDTPEKRYPPAQTLCEVELGKIA